jgi:hypothetical protein
MKKMILALLVLSLLALGGQAFAELCAIDAVPAATLLVPYFEVDLANAAGVTTLFSINNASAAPALAHVILWTNWSAPTVDFDIYLTGYDVVTVNMRDVFAGNIPITSDAPSDRNCPGSLGCGEDKSPNSNDDISPHAGDYANNPVWDDTNLALAGLQGFPVCDAFFPFFNNPMIGGTALDRLQNGHTGQPVNSLSFACGAATCCLGDDIGDVGADVAVGYITIDNVSECSLVLDPNTVGYFLNGGAGIVNNENQLWGDWYLVDIANAFAQGDTLVHIEANSDLNATQLPLLDRAGNTVATIANPTNYTFYGRYTQFLGGSDNREPLGSTWAASYLNAGGFSGTQYLVWRDSTCNDVLPAGALCSSGPSWFPLNETEVIAFDECEDAVELCFFTGGLVSPPDEEDPACFPYETGRYDVGVDPLDPPFDFGWMYLNLNLPPDNCIGDVDFPAGGGLIAQSYVVGLYNADGLYSVGLQAVELTNATQNVNPQIGSPVNNIPQF